MEDMHVIQDSNSVFTDYSQEARDFIRDGFELTYTAATDSLYIGLYKPFRQIYLEMESSSPKELNFTINGNSVAVYDETRGLSRSGFMQFTPPTNWSAESINGVNGYWLKIDIASDATVNFSGINIVFADDNDLKTEIRNIELLLAQGDTSFIAYHQGARDEIIQTLRNGGRFKKLEFEIKNLTKWDILEIGEIRNAAKYLCLAKIFFDVSKNNDDKYYTRFRDFQGMYGNAFDTYILKLDTKDNGKYEEQDDLVFNSGIEIQLG